MLQTKSVLFSTAYLAPIAYYQHLQNADNVCIEQHEFFQKQSYRSRCRIATANGVMDLTVPVEKGSKTLIRDLKISNHNDWQVQHWRSIEAAYNSSPFFEYYADDFRPFFEKKWLFLWDFNIELLYKTLELLDIEKNIRFSANYSHEVEVLDLRDLIHPKKEEKLLVKPYYQVFRSKYGFLPHLSIIDLLFNMGNESQLIIERQSEQ